MNTAVLSADAPKSVDRAGDVLRKGGLVAFPTDTVYGLGAPAFNAEAVMRIYVAKGRPPEKAIPVLLASAAELELVVSSIPPAALVLAGRFWPGPLTLVMPKHHRVPEAVAADTVGVRVPDHAVARSLLAISGPLAVTSANLSGSDSPITAAEVIDQLGGRIDMVLDGGTSPGGVASTVLDCTGPQLVVLRPGPLSLEVLRAALR